MTQKRGNIFEEASQIISLDCSSIEVSHNTTIYNNGQQSLKQSILNLKSVLPTFTQQFNIFKEEIIQMFYYTINKLMNVVKSKTGKIQFLEQEIKNYQQQAIRQQQKYRVQQQKYRIQQQKYRIQQQKSRQIQEQLTKCQYHNLSMKKQVMQLKQMINQFMSQYQQQTKTRNKQLSIKNQQIVNKNKVLLIKQSQIQNMNKVIKIKQKQLNSKNNQINQIKNILKLNFNSPRNTCPHCNINILSANQINLNLLLNTQNNLLNTQNNLLHTQNSQSINNLDIKSKINQITHSINQSINYSINQSIQQHIQSTKQNNQNNPYCNLNLNNFFTNLNKSQDILIQMSESIVCDTQQINKRKSLQIIQQENSQVTSITDYLQSQRNTIQQNTSKSISQAIKSTRSGQQKYFNQDKQSFINSCKQSLLTNGKQSFFTGGKRSLLQNKNPPCTQINSVQYLSDCDKTIKDHQSPLGKINIFQNIQNRTFNDTFSSRVTNKNYNYQNIKSQAQRQRRSSQSFIAQKSAYQGFKIQKKPHQRQVLANIMIQNETPLLKQVPKQQNIKQQLSLKAQLQQISKSSSCSEINYFGQNEKININLPKKFQSPRNMNFIKKNNKDKQTKEQRIKTQPTYRDQDINNKQNINIQYHSKPVEMGRKIFARKKMIMTHAKATTSRVQNKKTKQQTRQIKQIKQTRQIKQKPINTKSIDKLIEDSVKNHNPIKNNLIQIKYIQSPQKQPSKSSHLLKPSVATIFSSCVTNQSVSRNNTYMEYSSTSSNISNINQSVVKTHHMYHSTGKNQSQSTPKNIHKITMTPGKPQSKVLQRKSISKSKQKLKVTSKSINHQHNSSTHSLSNTKQKFYPQTQNSFYTSNSQSISKLKNKNLSIHIGNNHKTHSKQNLIQIKNALINYNLNKIFTNLKEVYFDGKIINGLKQGEGKIVYDNGIIYQGLLKANKREGDAKLTLNGINIYQGNFSCDKIQGQGYLKFFKYLSNFNNPCPKVLQDASYYGRFINNSFDGMGTLFLNQTQKIVTKFAKGVPYGQFTFYNQNDIQFGHWPNQ